MLSPRCLAGSVPRIPPVSEDGWRRAVSAMPDRLLHHGQVLKCGARSWRTVIARGFGIKIGLGRPSRTQARPIRPGAYSTSLGWGLYEPEVVTSQNVINENKLAIAKQGELLD
jgi:hypothetical protein